MSVVAALLAPGPTRVMGVLNVTSDSFSDGGRFLPVDAAVAHGLRLHREGADLVDVGGESTRPGATRVPADVELARVVPVVERLAAAGVAVSVDTMRADVARAAVAAGAVLVNDVSGGLADPAMLPTVAGLGCGYVAMHWRGHARHMAAAAVYQDVVAEVCGELAARRDAALAAGIAPPRLVLDPGIGFAKTAEHNWTLLQHWDVLERLGCPLLLAVSRKRFLGALLDDRPPIERDAATAYLSGHFAARGVWGVRVHDVRSSVDAVRAAERLASR